MNIKTKCAIVVTVASFCAALRADVEHCSILSAGAETTLPGSYHNVGQMIIGISTNATITAHHGGMACLRVHTTCLLGDVNGDGFINGLDAQGFSKVKITGIGTPRELCAASLTQPAFVNLLLTNP